MSSVPIGGQGHIGIRKEYSFASGGAVEDWQPFISESIELTYNNVYSDRVQNSAEQVYGQQGNESVTGNVTFALSPKNPTQWLDCGIGQAVSPWYVERPLKSMLIQIDRETAAVQASGCMINGLTFGSSSNNPLTCSVDLEAAGLSSCTGGTPAYTASDAPYLHEEATFSLNGTADTSITAFSVAIANNLVTDLFGNSRKRLDIPAGKLLVTGSFSKLFDDTTERNAFLNAQVRTFKATFSRGSNNFTIWLPSIRYNTHPENITGQSEYIIETFNFTSFVNDPSTENSIRISGDFS